MSYRMAGSGLLAKVMQQFVQDAARCIVLVNKAIESDTLQKIGEVAHGLEGICLNLGVIRLAEHCQYIERQAKEGIKGKMTEQRQQVSVEFSLAMSILHENLSSLRLCETST